MSEKLSPFDISKNINEKQGPLDDLSDYNAWMINRIFSLTKDTVFFANEMNSQYHLQKDMQYDFYYYGLDKKKRYGKWHKKEKFNSALHELVKRDLCYSNRRSEEILDLITPEQAAELKAKYDEGGKKTKSAKG